MAKRDRSGKRPDDFVFEYLRSNPGDSFDLNLAGSVAAPIHCDYAPPTDFLWVRTNMQIIDGTIRPDRFGGLTGLTNGIQFTVISASGDTIKDFNDGVPITTHMDLASLGGNDVVTTLGPAPADDAVLIRWTVENSGGRMHIRPGERIRMTIRDDFTGLTRFTVMIQGVFGNPSDNL